MKKLFTLIIGAGLALTIQAQSGITNTLGTGGFFNIESASNTKLMSVGNISYGSTNLTLFSFFNEPGLDTDLKIHNNGTTNLFINLMKARGIAGALENVENGDVLGTINFEGYHGGYHPSATISAKVTGTPGSHVPGELIFKTGSETSAPVIRMTINNSGTASFHNDVIVAGRTYLYDHVNAKKSLIVEGAVRMNVKSLVADTTLDDTHYTVLCTVSGKTVTLPKAASDNSGQIYIIKSGAGVTTTVAPPTGGQTIDGSTASISIPAWKYIRVQSTATSWIITGGNY